MYLDHLGRDISNNCDDDLGFAQELAYVIYSKHWNAKGVVFKPADTIIGALKQIHNMTYYMIKEPAQFSAPKEI